MHHRPSREVERAQLVQEAALAPDPVRERVVDERRPEHREEEERREPLPLGERAGDERGRDGREHHLEEHERLVRDGGGVPRVRRRAHATQAGPLEPADDAAAVGPEGKAVSEEHPLQRDDAENGERLHERRQHVLLPHHPAVEEGEAGHGHEEDERGADEYPGGVAFVDHDRCGTAITGPDRLDGRIRSNPLLADKNV